MQENYSHILFWPPALETRFQWQSIASCQFVILQVRLISPDWMWSMRATDSATKKIMCAHSSQQIIFTQASGPRRPHSTCHSLDIKHTPPLTNTAQEAIPLKDSLRHLCCYLYCWQNPVHSPCFNITLNTQQKRENESQNILIFNRSSIIFEQKCQRFAD